MRNYARSLTIILQVFLQNFFYCLNRIKIKEVFPKIVLHYVRLAKKKSSDQTSDHLPP